MKMVSLMTCACETGLKQFISTKIASNLDPLTPIIWNFRPPKTIFQTTRKDSKYPKFFQPYMLIIRWLLAKKAEAVFFC